jgi:hypothetical protein
MRALDAVSCEHAVLLIALNRRRMTALTVCLVLIPTRRADRTSVPTRRLRS